MGNQTTSRGLNPPPPPSSIHSFMHCREDDTSHTGQTHKRDRFFFFFLFFVSLRRVFLFCFSFYFFLWLTSRSWGRNGDWQFDNATQCRFYFENDIGNVYGTLRENYGHTQPGETWKGKYYYFFFFSNEATNGLILIHHSQCVVLCVHYAYIACSLLYVFIPPAEISWVPFLAVVVVFTGCAQTDDMRTLLRGTSLLKLLTRQYNIVRRLARCLVRWDLNRRITLVENLLF